MIQVRFMFKYSLDRLSLTLIFICAQIIFMQVDIIYLAKDDLLCDARDNDNELAILLDLVGVGPT